MTRFEPVGKPVLYLTEEASVRECLRLMKKFGVRAALLTRRVRERERIVGIFSETDLLKRATFLEHPLNWSRPISSIMRTKLPVVYFSQIERAAEVMIAMKVGSVIIAGTNEVSPIYRDQVWGMIHAADYLKVSGTEDGSKRKPIVRACIYAKSSRYVAYIGKLLKKNYEPHLMGARSVFSPGEPPKFFKSLDVLFLDLNQIGIEAATEIMKVARNSRDAPVIIYVADESLLPKTTIRALLRANSRGGRMGLLLKPINPLEFELVLERSLESKRANR